MYFLQTKRIFFRFYRMPQRSRRRLKLKISCLEMDLRTNRQKPQMNSCAHQLKLQSMVNAIIVILIEFQILIKLVAFLVLLVKFQIMIASHAWVGKSFYCHYARLDSASNAFSKFCWDIKLLRNNLLVLWVKQLSLTINI